VESFNEGLKKYTLAEQDILEAKLKAIRATITHPAEKGRAVEHAIFELLRSILPKEYGISTGFIAYHTNNCIEENHYSNDNEEIYECRYDEKKDEILISPQIDMIIYDALRFGPIVRLGSCDVFPLEAVCAYIEIKSWINSKKDKTGRTPLENILIQSEKLRSYKVKLYRYSIPGSSTKAVLIPYPLREVISMRSFVIILDTDDSLGTAEDIKDQLDNYNNQIKGFLSGMYIQGKGFYQSYHGEEVEDPLIGTFKLDTSEDSIAIFKNELYTALYRYPRTNEAWTPAIDRYHNNDHEPSPAVQSIKSSKSSKIELRMNFNSIKNR